MSAQKEIVAKQVAVVITCYNDGVYLSEAIDSLGPERADGEGVIIVNDGSSEPETLAVLDRYGTLGFTRIDTVNRGLAAARRSSSNCIGASC